MQPPSDSYSTKRNFDFVESPKISRKKVVNQDTTTSKVQSVKKRSDTRETSGSSKKKISASKRSIAATSESPKKESHSKLTRQKMAFGAAAALVIAGGVHYLIDKREAKDDKVLKNNEKIIDYGAFFSNYSTHSAQEKARFFSELEAILLKLDLSTLERFLKDIPVDLHQEKMMQDFVTYVLSEICRQYADKSELLPFLDRIKEAIPGSIPKEPLLFFTNAHSNCLQLPELLQEHILHYSITTETAFGILRLLAHSKTSVGTDAVLIQRLCAAANISEYHLLEQWNFHIENTSLLAILIVFCPREKQEEALKKTVIAFCKKGDFEAADALMHTLLPSVERKRQPQGMLSSLYGKLTYLCAYSLWQTLHYTPGARFEGVERERIQEYISNENFGKVEEFFAGPLLHQIGEVVQNVRVLTARKDDVFEKALIWLYEKKLPLDLAKAPDFVSFLQRTKLHTLIKFYKHALQTPTILVEGAPVPYIALTERFTLRQGKNEIEIIEKATKKRWYYMEEGLVPHDPEQELRPFKTVDRSDEENPQHLLTFNYISEGHTQSLSGIKRLREHIWINLCRPDGHITSVGNLTTGIRSPDPYEFLPSQKKSITFPITKIEFNKLLQEIGRKQRGEKESFNLARANCSSFCGQVATTIFPRMSPKVELGMFYTLESRIKAFVIARELASLCVHKREQLHSAIQASKVDSPGSLTSKFHNEMKKLVGEDATYREYLGLFKIFGQNPLYLQAFDRLVVQFQSSLLTDPQNTIQSKLFNLINDMFVASKEITIDTPAKLFEQLTTYKKK